MEWTLVVQKDPHATKEHFKRSAEALLPHVGETVLADAFEAVLACVNMETLKIRLETPEFFMICPPGMYVSIYTQKAQTG